MYARSGCNRAPTASTPFTGHQETVEAVQLPNWTSARSWACCEVGQLLAGVAGAGDIKFNVVTADDWLMLALGSTLAEGNNTVLQLKPGSCRLSSLLTFVPVFLRHVQLNFRGKASDMLRQGKGSGVTGSVTSSNPPVMRMSGRFCEPSLYPHPSYIVVCRMLLCRCAALTLPQGGILCHNIPMMGQGKTHWAKPTGSPASQPGDLTQNASMHTCQAWRAFTKLSTAGQHCLKTVNQHCSKS